MLVITKTDPARFESSVRKKPTHKKPSTLKNKLAREEDAFTLRDLINLLPYNIVEYVVLLDTAYVTPKGQEGSTLEEVRTICLEEYEGQYFEDLKESSGKVWMQRVRPRTLF